ncbi:hypothetical protein THRCLA_11252 [Thraustotheca clavata]|uniref:WRKY19-like zinc finger domain-containing protein n=1 Tax=Thraustotheca clavata TaxID=74557 RepID=A0A1V9Y8E7_9STRA|nr:hypothetical protein THRCLA_11252 [Thraustotheca clavata]
MGDEEIKFEQDLREQYIGLKSTPDEMSTKIRMGLRAILDKDRYNIDSVNRTAQQDTSDKTGHERAFQKKSPAVAQSRTRVQYDRRVKSRTSFVEKAFDDDEDEETPATTNNVEPSHAFIRPITRLNTNSISRQIYQGPKSKVLESFDPDGPYHPSSRQKKKKRTSRKAKFAKVRGYTVKPCEYPGCDKWSRTRGLCKRHGGGKRCQIEGCPKSDQGGGYCIKHGGGKRCSVAKCKNSAQVKGLCKSHGGVRRPH